MAWLLLLAAAILIIIGLLNGGCRPIPEYEGSRYFSYYYSKSRSACVMSVIGFLIMFIPVPILLFLPCILKK
jgi:hypothetical protein